MPLLAEANCTVDILKTSASTGEAAVSTQNTSLEARLRGHPTLETSPCPPDLFRGSQIPGKKTITTNPPNPPAQNGDGDG